MCYTHKLCETNHGEVSASCCGTCLKIVYKNLVMIHNYEGFEAYYKNVEECVKELNIDQGCGDKEMVFATQAKNIFLQYNEKEIRELYYLLQSSLIEYHINSERFVEIEPCE